MQEAHRPEVTANGPGSSSTAPALRATTARWARSWHTGPGPARLGMLEHPSHGLDGVWWPRTDLLADELIPLNEALLEGHGLLHRVRYSPVAWSLPPASSSIRLGAGGHVRLQASTTLPPHLVQVSTLERAALWLMVAPSTCEPAEAWAVLREAVTLRLGWAAPRPVTHPPGMPEQ